MKGDASIFGNKAQGRVKTRQGSHSRSDSPRARIFQPYRARDRPVSDLMTKVRTVHTEQARAATGETAARLNRSKMEKDKSGVPYSTGNR